ncbi:MAG: hypothetical protein H6Q73_1295 [Firmicutes bacterium]|nr:hypothetical protein [Bacillota bacterium]
MISSELLTFIKAYYYEYWFSIVGMILLCMFDNRKESKKEMAKVLVLCFLLFSLYIVVNGIIKYYYGIDNLLLFGLILCAIIVGIVRFCFFAMEKVPIRNLKGKINYKHFNKGTKGYMRILPSKIAHKFVEKQL